MPTFTFTSPDGKNYNVTGPEGATQEQAFQILQQQMGSGTAKPTEAPAPVDETKAAFGVRPHGIRQRTEADVAKEQELAAQFGRDPSRAGQLSAADYARRMAGGAVAGGAIGAGLGAFTGPGALATGGAGAVMGGLSGLAEAAAEDLGFGPGTQAIAGMAVPSPGKIGQVGKRMLGEAATDLMSKGVTSAKDLVAEIAAHKMFGWGAYPVRRAVSAMEKAKPIDVAALEATTGVKGAAKIQPGSVENTMKARQDIAQKYNIPADAPEFARPEFALYEQAKTQYDNLIRQGQDFTKSPEFSTLIANYPKESQKYMQRMYSKIFKEGGSLKPGDVVINDLKTLNLTPKQEVEIRQTFNDYLQRTTGKPLEQEARAAAEQVFVAKAKDQLPTLLTNSAKEVAGSADARRVLRSQIQNFSKNPEARQVFWEETANALKNMSVGDAKTLWGAIGPEVRKHMIKDPAQYQKITEIMSGAKTPKEISNAVRLMVKAGAVALMTPREE